ncbi:MAG: hypothetical protein Q4B17_09040, partial [Lautropia sp.]|nr:hypothetical protein [Lautropia sp.]
GAGAGGLRANGWRGWQVFSPEGRWLASADLLVLACREEAFSLAGMTEADHGRLRISAARVWTARADGGPPDEDPGFPALLPIAGGQGLALTRPGSFWLRSEERYQSWLQTGRWADDDSLSRMSVFLPGSHAPGESQDSTMSSAGFGFSYGDGLPENEATALAEFLGQPGSWHASAVGDRLQCRDNLPMIGPAPDLVRIAETADELARNDRLPMPRRAGLYLLTALAGRGSLYAALGAEMIAAHAFGEPAVVDDALVRAVDPARFIKRRLQRAWSQRLVAG